MVEQKYIQAAILTYIDNIYTGITTVYHNNVNLPSRGLSHHDNAMAVHYLWYSKV